MNDPVTAGRAGDPVGRRALLGATAAGAGAAVAGCFGRGSDDEAPALVDLAPAGADAVVSVDPALAAAEPGDGNTAAALRDGFAGGDVYGVDVDGALAAAAARTDRDLGDADAILLVGEGAGDDPTERVAVLLEAAWPLDELAADAASATGLPYEAVAGEDGLYAPAADEAGGGDETAEAGDSAVDSDADFGPDPDEAGPPAIAALGDGRLAVGADALVRAARAVADRAADRLGGPLRDAFDAAPAGLVAVAVSTPDGVRPDGDDLPASFALRPLETVIAVAGSVEPAAGGGDGVRTAVQFLAADAADATDLEMLLRGLLPVLAVNAGEDGTIEVEEADAPAVREALGSATVERDDDRVEVVTTGEVAAAVALLEAF